MSLYNIVGTSSLQAGQPEDVSQVLANFQAIQTILNGGIDDVNIRSTAAIQLSKLNGYPGDSTKFARGDGVWAYPGVIGLYRKTTAKQVLNTTVETDLLNGEITLGANVLGANGALRLTAWCDWESATGAALSAIPRLKLKLGATTLIDTGAFAVANLILSSASPRYPFIVSALVQNLGATNSQLVEFSVDWVAHQSGSALSGYTVAYVTGIGETTIGPTTGSNVPTSVSSKGNNTTAVDTTAAQALALTVINPSANPTCDTTLRYASVDIA